MKPWLLFLLFPCLLFLKGHHKDLSAQDRQFHGNICLINAAENNNAIVTAEAINTAEQAILPFLNEDDDDDSESFSEKKKTGGSVFLQAINAARAQQLLSFNPCRSFYKHYSYLSPGIYIFNREIII